MKRTTRILTLLTALVLAFALVGCGSSDEADKSTAGDIPAIAYENEMFTVQIPDEFAVEDINGCFFISNDDVTMNLGIGEIANYAESWQDYLDFIDSFYDNRETRTVAGIEGILVDMGSGCSVVIPIDDINCIFFDLTNDSGEDYMDMYNSDEVQFMLDSITLN